MSLRKNIEEIDEIGRMFERWGLGEHFTETVKDSLFIYQGGARVKGIKVGSDVFEVWVLRDAPDQPEPREWRIYIGWDDEEPIAWASNKYPTAPAAWETALRAIVQMGTQS